MFRKNYVPKLKIRKDFQTGKWFAEEGNDTFDKSFVQYEDGKYGLSRVCGPTQFDTLHDLMGAIYQFALEQHYRDMCGRLTERSVNLST